MPGPIGLHHPLDGITNPKYKLLHFIQLTKFYFENKRALAFNREWCCHLATCLRLILFHSQCAILSICHLTICYVVTVILSPCHSVHLSFCQLAIISTWHSVKLIFSQWKGINCKQSTRWQHLSQLKASAFFSLQKNFSCYETKQLILGTGTAIWWVIEPH